MTNPEIVMNESGAGRGEELQQSQLSKLGLSKHFPGTWGGGKRQGKPYLTETIVQAEPWVLRLVTTVTNLHGEGLVYCN